MKQLQKRILATAERLQVRPVCRTCLGWGASTYCNEEGVCLRPESCPACGRVVPIRLRRIIVGVDLNRL
jgi:hypothetical protein